MLILEDEVGDDGKNTAHLGLNDSFSPVDDDGCMRSFLTQYDEEDEVIVFLNGDELPKRIRHLKGQFAVSGHYYLEKRVISQEMQ